MKKREKHFIENLNNEDSSKAYLFSNWPDDQKQILQISNKKKTCLFSIRLPKIIKTEDVSSISFDMSPKSFNCSIKPKSNKRKISYFQISNADLVPSSFDQADITPRFMPKSFNPADLSNLADIFANPKSNKKALKLKFPDFSKNLKKKTLDQIIIYRKVYKKNPVPTVQEKAGHCVVPKRPFLYTNISSKLILPEIRSKSNISNLALYNSGVPIIPK